MKHPYVKNAPCRERLIIDIRNYNSKAHFLQIGQFSRSNLVVGRHQRAALIKRKANFGKVYNEVYKNVIVTVLVWSI